MILEVEHLSKTFGRFTAVQDVSFSIPDNAIVGLVGPNGAGKTTTLHMILGLISPSSGSVRIFDKPFESNREEILQQMNFIAPYVTYPSRLTVTENLTVFARLYNVRDASAKIREMLRLFGIERLKDTPVSRLSSGENTRVGLSKALLNEPRLLLLDEPTAYLDPQAAQQVKQILLDRRKEHGTTILFTSHNMTEVEQLCECVYFLSRGKVLASGSPIAVTQAILQEHRNEPALVEAFLHVANRNDA